MVIIRQLAISDYAKVKEINIANQKQYLGDRWNRLTEKRKEEILISKKSEFGINVATGFCLVAEVDGEVVGFLLAHEALPYKGTVRIRHIAISPGMQGKGIGPALYGKLVDVARNKGIKVIEAYVNCDNPNSKKLHEKVGFKLRKVWRGELVLSA